jgi:hypothetical protein
LVAGSNPAPPTRFAYLEAEQRAGRLTAEASLPYLASALVGAALEYAFLSLLTKSDVVTTVAGLPQDAGEYAREVVQVVLAGHAKDREAQRPSRRSSARR